MRFVWDQRKNRENVRKHGIDFRDVPDMFSHPMLVHLDNRQDYGEDRWIGVGLLKNVVAVVVYVEWLDGWMKRRFGSYRPERRRAMRKTNTARESRTDWKKLAAKADAEIDTSDIAELDKDFFRHAQVRMPKAKQMVSLRVDSDVLDWFKRQGKGYQTRVNAVLRAYFEAHKR